MSHKPSAALRYTALRFGVFAASFLVVWGLTHFGLLPAGLGRSNPLWVLLLALVVSAPLSWVLLRRQRQELAEQIEVRVDRAKQKLSANQAQEDA